MHSLNHRQKSFTRLYQMDGTNTTNDLAFAWLPWTLLHTWCYVCKATSRELPPKIFDTTLVRWTEQNWSKSAVAFACVLTRFNSYTPHIRCVEPPNVKHHQSSFTRLYSNGRNRHDEKRRSICLCFMNTLTHLTWHVWKPPNVIHCHYYQRSFTRLYADEWNQEKTFLDFSPDLPRALLRN